MPFPASAATLDQAEMVFFPRSPFLAMLAQHPPLALNMLSSLSRHLRHLTDVIESLSFQDVSQRLATYLLKLSKNPPDPMPGETSAGQNNVVMLDLIKNKLASSLGTIPATLSRAFSYLRSEGLIQMEGSRIQLLDGDRLPELSQLSQPNLP